MLSRQDVGGFHCFIENIYEWNVLWTRANPELLWKDPEAYQLGAKLRAFPWSSLGHTERQSFPDASVLYPNTGNEKQGWKVSWGMWYTRTVSFSSGASGANDC